MKDLVDAEIGPSVAAPPPPEGDKVEVHEACIVCTRNHALPLCKAVKDGATVETYSSVSSQRWFGALSRSHQYFISIKCGGLATSVPVPEEVQIHVARVRGVSISSTTRIPFHISGSLYPWNAVPFSSIHGGGNEIVSPHSSPLKEDVLGWYEFAPRSHCALVKLDPFCPLWKRRFILLVAPDRPMNTTSAHWALHATGRALQRFRHLYGQMAQIWRCHDLMTMNSASVESGSDSEGDETAGVAENAITGRRMKPVEDKVSDGGHHTLFVDMGWMLELTRQRLCFAFVS
ncbi:hypothetical protein Dimus_016146 [Dionaea muscipula]